MKQAVQFQRGSKSYLAEWLVLPVFAAPSALHSSLLRKDHSSQLQADVGRRFQSELLVPEKSREGI